MELCGSLKARLVGQPISTEPLPPSMSTISSEIFSEKRTASNFKTGWFDGRGDGVQQSAVKIEEEDERLIQLGIRRELRKEFTNFSTISAIYFSSKLKPWLCAWRARTM